MRIIHTFFYWSYFVLFLGISISFYIPIGILHITGMHTQKKKLVTFLSKNWARMVVWLTGSKVTVEGSENFPKDEPFCVVSNHQGDFDIPTIMSIVPDCIAFVAKKELQKIPVLGWWMTSIGVVFLDRSSNRKAVSTFNEAAKKIQEGHPMVIFPEGTRSKGGPVAPFKKGSLKLAVKANALIVPITLIDTYKMLEANKGPIVTGTHIKVKVHPPVDIRKFTPDELEGLAQKLEEQIKSGLE